MTRARQSLLLARMDGHAYMLDGIERAPGLIFRQLPRPRLVPPELYRLHKRAELSEVDLSFAGRFQAGNKVHRSIERLQPGDPLELRQQDGKWELFDKTGGLVGRMARRNCVMMVSRRVTSFLATFRISRRFTCSSSGTYSSSRSSN